MRGFLKRLLSASRDTPDPRFAAAYEHFLAGRAGEARAICETLIAERSDYADALWLLGKIACESGDTASATELIGRAIVFNPSAAKYHLALGYARQVEADLDGAAGCYHTALDLDPRYAEAWNNLGCVMQLQGRLAEAADHFRKALEINPALAQANQNLGSLMRDPHRLEAAAENYRKAIREQPGDASLYVDLGNTLRDQEKFDEAIASFDAALKLKPDHAEAHFSKALVLLLKGELALGWEEYEWRWQREPQQRSFAAPQWDGRNLPDGDLLLYAEQGFGDTLQFIRYAPLAARRCRRVIVECRAELKSLVAAMPGVAQVVAPGEPLPQFAAHLPLLSLPRVFKTTLETIPAEVPYLRAEPEKLRAWRARLAADGDAFKIGLCWAGRPEYWDNNSRSAALDSLAPLGSVRGAVFYSLQKGSAAGEAARPPAGMTLQDFSAELRDFSDTAALVAALDLVITVDTSVAHLAGALGAPTWVMIPRPPEWRWLLAGERSPWYPTMRLFRQDSANDWRSVVERIARALSERIARALSERIARALDERIGPAAT
jgi:tetratricopeptide (TPR) repeat protein